MAYLGREAAKAPIVTADLPDNGVTLAKMTGGTDGNIISYDASGNPVAIATGSDGQVLTSTGAGSPPAFEAGGVDAADIGAGVLPVGVTGGSGISGVILQSEVATFGSEWTSSSDHSVYQTVSNLTHTDFVVGAGNKVFLILSLRANINQSAAALSVKIRRDSTVLTESINNFYNQGGTMGSQLAFTNLETPGAGTYTYTVQVKNRLNEIFYVNPNVATNVSNLTIFEIKG